MKKLFSLLTLLICAVMLSTTAYTASELPDPYQLYKKAAKKIDTVTSMDVTGNISMTITLGTNKLPASKSVENFKILKIKDNRIQLEATITDADTKKVKSSEWYKDGYCYTNSDNTKTKQKSELDSIIDYFGGFRFFDATESDFKDATIEKTKDGFYRISYKMSAKKAFPVEYGSEVRLSNVKLSITVDADGNMKATSASITLNTNADDGTLMKVTTTMSHKINSLNSVSKINFPSDLNTYKTSK